MIRFKDEILDISNLSEKIQRKIGKELLNTMYLWDLDIEGIKEINNPHRETVDKLILRNKRIREALDEVIELFEDLQIEFRGNE